MQNPAITDRYSELRSLCWRRARASAAVAMPTKGTFSGVPLSAVRRHWKGHRCRSGIGEINRRVPASPEYELGQDLRAPIA